MGAKWLSTFVIAIFGSNAYIYPTKMNEPFATIYSHNFLKVQTRVNLTF